MEDFYITLKVIQGGKKAIAEPDAIAIEDVSNEIKEEFNKHEDIDEKHSSNIP